MTAGTMEQSGASTGRGGESAPRAVGARGRPALPRVSVIIPAYNEAEHLRECLASWASQTYAGECEVVLVDNGSTDETAAVCAAFPFVRYVYFDRCKSSYGARNEGARQSGGELLVFFDADQTALPNCLTAALSEYVHGDAEHVYCGRLADDPRVPQVLRDFLPQEDPDADPDELLRGRIRTAYVAVPRALFERLGGFKEGLRSGGDFEFFERAAKVARVHRAAEVGALHYWAKDVGEVLAREERFGFGMCLRARADAAPLPSVPRHLGKVLKVGAVKLAAAVAVPLRYPASKWRYHWAGQLLHWRATVRHFVGILKYRAGARRAGDLA